MLGRGMVGVVGGQGVWGAGRAVWGGKVQCEINRYFGIFIRYPGIWCVCVGVTGSHTHMQQQHVSVAAQWDSEARARAVRFRGGGCAVQPPKQPKKQPKNQKTAQNTGIGATPLTLTLTLSPNPQMCVG